ncbi:uncharacterized protein PFL1_06450 [Pseudozyma flocculosa PF-1]|uniref:Succinate dehydrogenase [ubiquinone] cytochrome b small subunit n=2 Tax=Pseudozyma flocculosa TaxID=84751 RepID=A0A5C3EX84_9BASI|nr:uncharacterized protein PFL1_06450 [Pseudozyma flocculosa PF-1]EPQ25995.1 hypothetical protein PFL1_06450 [Pseudozyma flocculosa PF-1]SPO35701.1 related to succinate dehydrogenase [ubiquinone] cytochrome b small subunit, mitochondrial precursor [Pseudozyma flocculosa]
MASSRSALLALQPLRLHASATSPHLRMMAMGARGFQTAKPQGQSAVAASRQGPYVKGTVNDPTPFPTPNPVHGSYHWSVERLLSVALVPIVGAGMVKHGSSGLLDGALAISLLVHSHIGFDVIRSDYLHPRKFPILGPILIWALRAASAGALYGLYEINTNDVGLSEFVARVWTA